MSIKPDIKLIVTDIDGTLTDGGIYYTESGDEFKKFSSKDGMGFQLAHEAGLRILAVTGRKSAIVSKRMGELKVEYVAQGIGGKAEFLTDFLKDKPFSLEQICYIGDDLNDLEAMRLCGAAACPSDAVAAVRAASDYVAEHPGGAGAFRDCVEWLLSFQP